MGTKSRPPLLLLAAAVLAAESLALLAYTVTNVVDIMTGNSYQVPDSVGLIIIQVIVVVGLAWIASGVRRVRPWTRTPAVMIQLFGGLLGILLLNGHQYAWGGPTLALAVAGLAGLLPPASLKALARPMPEPEPPAPKPNRPKNTGKPKSASDRGNASRSGNPAKRNPAGKPASRLPVPLTRAG
jgi:hypothetical protein